MMTMLKYLRVKKGISLRTLGDETGIGYSRLFDYENDVVKLSLVRAAILADFYEIPVLSLLESAPEEIAVPEKRGRPGIIHEHSKTVGIVSLLKTDMKVREIAKQMDCAVQNVYFINRRYNIRGGKANAL